MPSIRKAATRTLLRDLEEAIKFARWRGWAERIGTNFLDASLTDEQLRERVTALLVSQHEQLTDAALGAPVHD